MGKFTITTSIFYPNAAPHLGHAFELVQADFLARYHRMIGDDVYFQTGLDVHGQKMQTFAERAGMTAADFTLSQESHFTDLVRDLNSTPDHFIKTNDAQHMATAQAMWKMCEASGDIYKKTYRAWYNVKQEEFLGSVEDNPNPDVFGVDPAFVELIEEENYFFAASKYTDQVLGLLRSESYKIVPANRAKELIRFVEEKGMQDVSISRDKNRLSLGIPVPGDDSQVMYVWFDALTNYLSGCSSVEGDKIVTDDRWPADLHCVGKDIARFHGLLWPAMLLSAGLPIPERLLVHGFVLRDGRVMSKSLGNGISLGEALAPHGVDALRWFFLRAMPTTEDGDFSLERLSAIYASDLANDYGNLVSRVLAMTHKYRGGNVPQVTTEQVSNLEKVIVHEVWGEYTSALEGLELDQALAAAQKLLVFSNRRIEELKPWVIAKDESRAAELDEVLYELLEIIRHASVMLWPAIPTTVERVQKEMFISVPHHAWTDPHSQREWGKLEPGSQLGPTPFILFPRTEA